MIILLLCIYLWGYQFRFTNRSYSCCGGGEDDDGVYFMTNIQVVEQKPK